MRVRYALAAVLVTSIWVATGSTSETGVRGFPRKEAEAQRALEARFRDIPDPARLRDYMRVISEEPHHAGSPGSRKVAEYILARFKEWGLDASIEEHEALMPMPTERVLELTAPVRFTATLKEPPLADDKDSNDPNQLPTYNAYSADGDVTAEVVYVNYGTPEDYEQLAKLGIEVKGRIVLARYGLSWRGIKPKVAAEHGAIGCIIYSDPRDDGFFQGDVYPNGAWRPEHGAQRGSVMDMPLYPGDPLTPGWASEKGGRKLERAEAATLVKIPVLPISYGDALPILKELKGPVAPEGWRGALPVTYHVGPGPATVHVKLTFDWQTRPLYNVIARIPGSVFPDEWIVHGNHHDAWVNGAEDPTSGAVSLMETARGFAELVKGGWRPARTVIFAAWDGEEWGLLGSTEWAEKHANELSEKVVAYINTDSTGKGWLSAGGSPSLQKLVNDVTRDIDGPRSDTSVFDEARARMLDRAKTAEERAEIEKRPDLSLDPLGSGSDYTAFLDHLAIASLNLGFEGESEGGIYHSVYDTFNWYTRYSDGDFSYGRALSQTVGTLMLRLADAPVLPFQFADYAAAIRQYVGEIEKDAKGGGNSTPSEVQSKPLELPLIRRAVEELERVSKSYEEALERFQGYERVDVASNREMLAQLNKILYSSERRFAYPIGLPRREWFKHLIYAPGFYTGYGVKTLPAIREAAEQKAWEEARSYMPAVATAIRQIEADLRSAIASLQRIESP